MPPLDLERPFIEGMPPEISIVIPVMNEEDSVSKLVDRITKVCSERRIYFEVVFVDDGSTDGTWGEITEIVHRYPDLVRAIRLRRNMGKAQALAAGFQEVRGSVVITMDGDLQDDPKEIPRMLEKNSEGYDLVVGWKRNRLDPWSKLISSKIFNWLANKASGLQLHDHNCGFKCYSRGLLDELRLYGDMHRMVPSLASAQGFSIAEIPVEHHARRHGVSKYGFGRGLRSFMDLWTVLFLRHFRDRPGHFIGPMAVVMLVIGLCFLGVGLYRDLTTGQGKVLLTVGPMAVIIGLTLFNTSLMAEMMVYDQFSKSWTPPIADRVGDEPAYEMKGSSARPAQKVAGERVSN